MEKELTAKEKAELEAAQKENEIFRAIDFLRANGYEVSILPPNMDELIANDTCDPTNYN
jgi:hypothetical protein